jgi:RNA polymerase sigma-70 factor (ECF subfamily)
MQPLTPAAFALQFQGSWRALWCIAAAVVGDRAQADDVLQEAALVALGKLGQFDPASNFTAWMGQIVRFVALNQARKRTRSPASSVDPHSIEVTAVSTPATDNSSPLTGQGQLNDVADSFDERLLSALRGLDDTARACLLMRTLMDMPYRDISLSLNIPEGTAMSHVHRARISLRQRLEEPNAAGFDLVNASGERNGQVHG